MRRCQTMKCALSSSSRAGSQGLRLRRAGAADRGIEQNHRDPPSMLRRAQSLVATLAMSATRMLWGAWQFRQPASRRELIATALKTNRPCDGRAHIFVCMRGSIDKSLPHSDVSKTSEIICTYDLGVGGEIMWVKKSRAA